MSDRLKWIEHGGLLVPDREILKPTVMARARRFDMPRTISMSYITVQQTNGSHSTSTYTGSLGDPAYDRLIVCVIGQSASTLRSITSATIGGVSATILGPANGNSQGVYIIYARTPSGSNVSVSWSATVSTMTNIGIWRIVGQASDTPTSSHFPAGGSDTTRTATITVTAGGVVIAGASGGSSTNNWTNATSRYNNNNGASRNRGADNSAPSAGSLGISNQNCRAIGAATWR